MREYDEEIAGRLMNDLMRDLGISRAQAAGIVGNLSYESGGFRTLQEHKDFKPGERGGYGYAQWTGRRRRQFEAYAAENNLDPASYEANYGFLKHELEGNHNYVMRDLRRDDTVEEASDTILHDYENPKDPESSQQRRINQSRSIERNPATGFDAPIPSPRDEAFRAYQNEIANPSTDTQPRNEHRVTAPNFDGMQRIPLYEAGELHGPRGNAGTARPSTMRNLGPRPGAGQFIPRNSAPQFPASRLMAPPRASEPSTLKNNVELSGKQRVLEAVLRRLGLGQ